ncbi:unnamed protein product [Cyprideis torosa]|uniref:Uncharacterized protein n=1 Tax=Cyprideis torosa TaxID=163714 RepID=A0A7R8ZNZ2_9CRUS|nr:unnamed protein product [Cyprideis torosa]CAG0897535.1 unnamed protein product [Cyprideis torosa]
MATLTHGGESTRHRILLLGVVASDALFAYRAATPFYTAPYYDHYAPSAFRTYSPALRYGYAPAAPAYNYGHQYGVVHPEANVVVKTVEPVAAPVPAPVAYKSAVPAPVAYKAAVPAPVAYEAAFPAPVAYKAAVPAPVAYKASEPADPDPNAAIVFHNPDVVAYKQYAPAYARTQYHAQTPAGEYKFGYVGDTSAREETRTADGVVTGQYSYVDSNNQPQQVNYVADALGFRVAATNLPVDANTPVVAAPVALAPAPVVRSVVIGDAVNPHVPYTPEVAAARADHFRTVEGALKRNKRSAEPYNFIIRWRKIWRIGGRRTRKGGRRTRKGGRRRSRKSNG